MKFLVYSSRGAVVVLHATWPEMAYFFFYSFYIWQIMNTVVNSCLCCVVSFLMGGEWEVKLVFDVVVV
jgi:hypothetical protein